MNSLTIRKWHAYLGMFIAPSVLFFSLTGAMQLFSLHEAHGSYHPPPLLEKLGKLHKDQVFEQTTPDSDHDAAPGAPGGEALADDHDAASSATGSAMGSAMGSAAGSEAHEHHHEHKAPRVSVYVLKWFCLFVALGLAISTAFGIWMGLKQTLRRRTHVILLLIGVVVPVILIMI